MKRINFYLLPRTGLLFYGMYLFKASFVGVEMVRAPKYIAGL